MDRPLSAGAAGRRHRRARASHGHPDHDQATGRGAPSRGYGAPARPVLRPLHRSELLEVLDWCCPGCDTAPDEGELNEAYEVVAVRRGAFVREVDGVRALIHAGTLTLATPGEVHHFRHPVPGGDACSVFRVSAAGVREMLGEFDPAQRDAERPRFPLPHAPLGGRAYLLHRLATRAAAGADPLEADEAAAAFLRASVACAHARARRPSGRRGSAPATRRARSAARAGAVEYTARVHDVLSRRFHEPLSLAEIGRSVHCSPFHLSRIVSAVSGVSIHRLLVGYRLRHTLEQVLDGGEQLSAIAYAAGFSSHSHLTAAFRREFGCSPHELRRRPPSVIRAALARPAAPGS